MSLSSGVQDYLTPNPLITLARPAIEQALFETVGAEYRSLPNGLDIVFQTMLSLGFYGPTETWRGNTSTIDAVARIISSSHLRAQDIRDFERQVIDGQLQVNLDLVREIVAVQFELHARRVDRLFNSLTAARSICSQPPTQLASAAGTLTRRGRQWGYDEAGNSMLVVREGASGARVIMRRVDPGISRQYAEHLHYIHASRPDEWVAFGAFLGDQDVPFAWVSYSPIGTRLDRGIAAQVESDVTSVAEMTRAWSAPWAPKNTLSALFAFAHRQLQVGSANEDRLPEIHAVLTAINPNLGFTGMAFRGVDFGLVGLRPTQRGYIIHQTIPVHVLKHADLSGLACSVDPDLARPVFVEGSLPLRPTTILMLLMRGTARIRPHGPVQIVH